MSTEMDDLATWLRAQLDEDERVALNLSGSDGWVAVGLAFVDDSDGHQVVRDESMSSGVQAHIARHDPARVLAEVEAKRRLLDEYEAARNRYVALADVRARSPELIKPTPNDEERRAMDMADAYARAVRLLAMPQADEPGYREEWAP